MKYIDRIYGEVKISEPVFLELIKSPTLQRLKGIDQGGYYEVHFPGTGHARFEHSLGVYMLLKKYQASVQEQIAGLLHDVSHAAFSHCADYYFSEGSEKKQSHQDNSLEGYIRQSEIPEILKKFNFDLDYILDDGNFPLKEKSLPDLCADRLDYSLRGIKIFSIGSQKDVDYFLAHLKTKDARWFFDDFESAQKYADFFKKLNEKYYSGLPTALMFRTVGDYIKYALKKRYISRKDLYATDKKVISKISQFHKSDKKLENFFRRMNNQVKYKNDPEDFEAHVFCKSRIVDPLCQHEGRIKRISQINPEWKRIIVQEMKPKEYFIKFLE
jgi:uncharacterized protein